MMVRKILAGCTLLMLISHSYAGFSLGIDLHSDLRFNRSNTGLDVQSNNMEHTFYNLSVGPSFLIDPNELVEFNPFFKFNFYSNKYNGSGAGGSSSRFWGFDFGYGVYFRLIKGDIFRFSLGPRAAYGIRIDPDDDRKNNSLNFGVPANIDIRFSERFFGRTALTIVNAGYQWITGGGVADYKNSTFSLTAVTNSAITLGFYFTF